MKPYCKDLYGRNHRYKTCESKRVPKSSDDRKGTKTYVRMKAKIDAKKEIELIK